METLKYEAIATGFGLLEAPRIDDWGRVYFSDTTRGGVFRVAPGGKPETLVSAERKGVGGLAFTEDGGLIMTGPTVALWYEGGPTFDLIDNYPGRLSKTFNDLTVDNLGSVFVGSVNGRGTMSPDGIPDTDPGDVYRIDPDGTIAVIWEGALECSNGMGFSPDGKSLYLVDAFARCVYVHDVTADRSLRNRRVFAKFTEGWPDGLAIDAEGGVWAPELFAGAIHRFNRDGTLDRTFEAPGKKVISLVFGGADLRDLVVVVAKGGGVEGTVYKTRAPVAGLAVPKAKISKRA
jgi:sugar lactone lactonase YvrE